MAQRISAAAAYSTVLKNTSDIIRHSLRADRFDDDVSSELPELVVRELTAREIAELRDADFRHQANQEDDEALDGTRARDDDTVVDDELNEVIEEGV